MEVKLFFFLSSRCKYNFSSNGFIVYYQIHLYCGFFLAQKVKKVISNRNWDGVSEKYGSH